jgi:transposase
MELLSRWLPQGAPLHLETWHLDEVAAQLILRVTSIQALVHCPRCRFPTRRLHRYDERTRADLPWAHVRVV